MIKKKWFTLIEIVLVITISASILTTMYAILTTLPKIKMFNETRQSLIQETNDAMDRFAILFQDYTIDYEEYYNRKKTGCSTFNEMTSRTVNGSGFCTIFTAYWNATHNAIASANTLYGSQNWEHNITYPSNSSLPAAGISWPIGVPAWPLSYWQYKHSFWDYGVDTDHSSLSWKPSYLWDSDDRDLWAWEQAIVDPKNVKELYLISHDGNRRLFLRRALKSYNVAGSTWDYYTIQVLKLRGFDAWQNHDFAAASDPTVYDGQIDTWACDYWQFFTCGWKWITNYENYKLPNNRDDWWVDLFDEKLNITDWNIQLSPVKNPDYAWTENEQQINPYIKITLTAQLNKWISSNYLWKDADVSYTLQNLYDTRGFYIQ